VSERLGKRHKTVAMWAYQMVSLVRRWLPDRSIKLMGDTAYSVLELGLHAQAQQVTLITTGRLDAVLHEPYTTLLANARKSEVVQCRKKSVRRT